MGREVPDFMMREDFACGPPSYMEAVKRILVGAGHDLFHYHQESFDIGAVDTAA